MSELTDAVDALTETVTTLTTTVDGMKGTVASANKRSWGAIGAVLFDIAVSVAVALSLIGLWHTTRDQQRDRNATRIAACQLDNQRRDDEVRSHDKDDRVLVSFAANPRTPQIQAFLKTRHDEYVKTHKHRVCTLPGITLYYSTTTTSPVTSTTKGSP